MKAFVGLLLLLGFILVYWKFVLCALVFWKGCRDEAV